MRKFFNKNRSRALSDHQITLHTPTSRLAWALVFLLLLALSALACWRSYEYGRSSRHMDAAAKTEISALQKELQVQQQDLLTLQNAANAANVLIATATATENALNEQTRRLEAENQSLRADLQFFETLIPSNNKPGISIRSIQTSKLSNDTLQWRVLLIQAVKDAPKFEGQLSINLNGTRNGAAWNQELSDGPMNISLQQYKRLEGTLKLPDDVKISNITATISTDDGKQVQDSRTVDL